MCREKITVFERYTSQLIKNSVSELYRISQSINNGMFFGERINFGIKKHGVRLEPSVKALKGHRAGRG